MSDCIDDACCLNPVAFVKANCNALSKLSANWKEIIDLVEANPDNLKSLNKTQVILILEQHLATAKREITQKVENDLTQRFKAFVQPADQLLQTMSQIQGQVLNLGSKVRNSTGSHAVAFGGDTSVVMPSTDPQPTDPNVDNIFFYSDGMMRFDPVNSTWTKYPKSLPSVIGGTILQNGLELDMSDGSKITISPPPPAPAPITASVTKAPTSTADDTGEITVAGGPADKAYQLFVEVKDASSAGLDDQTIDIPIGTTAEEAAQLIVDHESDPNVVSSRTGAVVEMAPAAGSTIETLTITVS